MEKLKDDPNLMYNVLKDLNLEVFFEVGKSYDQIACNILDHFKKIFHIRIEGPYSICSGCKAIITYEGKTCECYDDAGSEPWCTYCNDCVKKELNCKKCSNETCHIVLCEERCIKSMKQMCVICKKVLCWECGYYNWNNCFKCVNHSDYRCCNDCAKHKKYKCDKHCPECSKPVKCNDCNELACSTCNIHKECGKVYCSDCMWKHEDQKCIVCKSPCHYPFCSKKCAKTEYRKTKGL